MNRDLPSDIPDSLSANSPISDSPTASKLPADPPHVDEPIENLNLFSKRVENALVRQGIITPRMLLIHTPNQLKTLRNLGTKGLTEIDHVLTQLGWELPNKTNDKEVTLTRLIAAFSYNSKSYPLTLSVLINKINRYNSQFNWDKETVAQGLVKHPYVIEIKDGHYEFVVQHGDSPIGIEIENASLKSNPVEGKIALNKLWTILLNSLNEREREILLLRYGVRGDDPSSLQEIGDMLDINLTRERIRQIARRAFKKLRKRGLLFRPFHQLLAESIQHENGLLTPNEWERWLNEKTIWEADKSRPMLLQLLCAQFDEFHYLNKYNVATLAQIEANHLHQLESTINHILRQHKQTGLTLEKLVQETRRQLPDYFPQEVHQTTFILKAIELFDRVGLGAGDRYIYLRKKKQRLYPSANSDWAGKPGTCLHEWELKLRRHFEKIAWIGQIILSEDDFKTLCQIIQEEAQSPNYFTKDMEGQPRLVPAAVFMTTMVLSARYAERMLDEAIDEFWKPYMRTVWEVQYSQAFYVRCKKRFNAIIPFLKKEYSFEFPRMGKAKADVVTPVFRHALIPRYMQTDFAMWIRKNWRNILAVADTSVLLVAQLQKDQSLDYFSHRLKHFIMGKATAETAAALISNMAAAINLHVNDGESIKSISNLLADTPIEQELWQEIAKEFSQQKEGAVSSLRITKPRLTWVWSLDAEELALRIQNIILPAESQLEGDPDRLIWLDTPDADPLDSDTEVEVTPWRMKTGEHIVNDAFFFEPDGALNSQIILLTDLDEIAVSLDVPPHPAGIPQFFRISQQGAYGIPITPAQMGDGVWLICAKHPVILTDDDGEIIQPDEELVVPYPLNNKYNWAAQFTLNLPITVKEQTKKIVTIAHSRSQPIAGQPSLIGTRPITGLSRHVQPTFANTQIFLTIKYGGERLLKQASLWIQGQDGWRYQQPLAELRLQNITELVGAGLRLNLDKILPLRPNFYTLELRISLQPLLSSPLQFAVVPDLITSSLPDDKLFTPANPPHIILRGLDESALVYRKGMTVDVRSDNEQQITWTDLRQDPYLLLRFGKIDIPLMWSVSRFMVWLEPEPTKPFLTLDEMRQTTLRAIASRTNVESFILSVSNQPGRTFQLKRGRYKTKIGQSQLYDMVNLTQSQHTVINVQVGTKEWSLCEVRQRPQLPLAEAEYDNQRKTVLLNTRLEEDWAGIGRFVVESRTNPFSAPVELGQTAILKDIHLLPVALPDGVYILRLELDGSWLPLNENKLSFTVGKTTNELIQTPQLITEIRSKKLISPDLAEDFVLWWAEMAEANTAELISVTLYQLATVSAEVFEHFGTNHLQKLWSPLASIREVQNQTQWITKYGYLPAWILLSHSIILKIDGNRIRVYPIQLGKGGLEGTGYGRLSLTSNNPKTPVYIKWKLLSGTQVQVEVGIPAEVPNNDWSKLDIEDTYGLSYCLRCGRLTGLASFTIPEEINQAHLHGHLNADLRDINLQEEYGGYQLIGELFFERSGQNLLKVYSEYGIVPPKAEDYLPEPAHSKQSLLSHTTERVQLKMLIREFKRRAEDTGHSSFWASANRILNYWSDMEVVSQLGQASFALGVLLRTAAYNRQQFHKLLKDASLSELDIQNLLTALNNTAPAHVQWGLVWAELLFLHSPGGLGYKELD